MISTAWNHEKWHFKCKSCIQLRKNLLHSQVRNQGGKGPPRKNFVSPGKMFDIF